jgi:N-acetylglucosamine-6-phosphate deacetylase
MPQAPPEALRAIRDATIFTGEAWVENHALLIKHGQILDIVLPNKIPGDAEVISYPDLILTSGFIDAQVNGGGNVQFNNTPTVEACHSIAKAHLRYGTTRLLLTCITDTPDILQRALAASREARKTCSHILGIHLEGPHLGLERRGVHKADYIRPASEQDLQLYHPEAGEIMLMTVAPENVPPQTIHALRHNNVIVSVGHTNAAPEEIRAAIEAGATGFTHLFNGMGKPSQGGTTPADTALKETTVWCGMILDGFHVPVDMAKLALQAKPGKIFLVSDAMAPAATDSPQSFELYGEKINVAERRCVNHEGKLAGSSITMLDAVRHCVTKVGVSLEEALRMASLYPATFLGIDKHLGKLLPGYAADVVVLNPALELKAVL